MNFDVAAALRKSTGRAKSDVANKLVSMFLHEVSRKACVAGGMSVTDPRYAESVLSAFGRSCLYCGGELERDRASVEHLNGMNRASVGLHVPGNVAMACKRCNNEKRQDDQLLSLAENGWESFLSHDGSRCSNNCKACTYWIGIWPDQETRRISLASMRERVHRFQQPYAQFVQWSESARGLIRQKIEILYRDCQKFATDEIGKLTLGLELDFSGSRMLEPQRLRSITELAASQTLVAETPISMPSMEDAFFSSAVKNEEVQSDQS